MLTEDTVDLLSMWVTVMILREAGAMLAEDDPLTGVLTLSRSSHADRRNCPSVHRE